MCWVVIYTEMDSTHRQDQAFSVSGVSVATMQNQKVGDSDDYHTFYFIPLLDLI